MPIKSIENIRQEFQPDMIKVLFVGESPPNSGGFFYGNPGDFSPMTKHYQNVFENVFGETFASRKDFLGFFKSLGCYLDDICHEPVDNLPAKERKLAIVYSIDKLAKRIEDYKPEYVIAILKGIHGAVLAAVHISNHPVTVQSVPFAGMGNQKRFEAELREILRVIFSTRLPTSNKKT